MPNPADEHIIDGPTVGYVVFVGARCYGVFRYREKADKFCEFLQAQWRNPRQSALASVVPIVAPGGWE